MKQIKKTKKQESGRSMVEMVGVLAVMGLITAGAFVLITSALKSQKLTRVDDDVAAIVGGVRLAYATQQNFDNIAVADTGEGGQTAAAKCEAVMDLIGYKNTTSPFGGKYTLTATKADDNNLGGYFEISFALDSANTCTAILNRMKGVNGNVPGGSGCDNNNVVTLQYTKNG